VRSFINFDVLPLVEFVPDPSMSDEDAMELIRRPASEGKRKGGAKKGGNTRSTSGSGRWKESKDGDADTLAVDTLSPYDDDLGLGPDSADLFAKCLNIALESQVREVLPSRLFSSPFCLTLL
jgi:hypothetical protein